jgi:hypothetical protein
MSAKQNAGAATFMWGAKVRPSPSAPVALVQFSRDTQNEEIKDHRYANRIIMWSHS